MDPVYSFIEQDAASRWLRSGSATLGAHKLQSWPDAGCVCVFMYVYACVCVGGIHTACVHTGATVPILVDGFGGVMGRDRKPESITLCSPSPSGDEGNKEAGKPEEKKRKENVGRVGEWGEHRSGACTWVQGLDEAAGSEGRAAPRALGLQAECTPGRGPK